MHNPHYRATKTGRMATSGSSDLSMLNINQSISCLTCGRLDPSEPNEMLLIGTPTNLMAYDVHRNADLFYKEVCCACSIVRGDIKGSKGLVVSIGKFAVQCRSSS